MNLDYLVVAAHPDDAEIALGGTILLLKSQGMRVGVVDLTSGEPTPHGSEELRFEETQRATKKLGLDYRVNLGMANRSLEPSLGNRAVLAQIFREQRPKVIFCHHWKDSHPDHIAACQLTEAARFWAKLTKTTMGGVPYYPPRLLYYFSMHMRRQARPSIVLDISDHYYHKIEVLKCYETQLIEGRFPNPTLPLEDIESQARSWGWTIRVKYGEPLAAREELGFRSLKDLT